MSSILEAITGAGRAMLKRPGALLAAFGIYAALVGVIYLFVTTREATIIQLILTFFLLLLAVALFFALQAIGVRYASGEEPSREVLRRSFGACWKLLVVSLPVAVIVVIAVLILELIAKLVGGDHQGVQSGFLLGYLLPGIRAIILYLVVPLIAIRLWIAVTQEGVASAFKRLGKHFIGALAPRALAIYVIVALIFGALVWGLVFTRTQIGGPWVEIVLLAGRLAMAGVVIFIGWFLALGALAKANEEI
jgi:hypothetical protein